jgi:hypothetical protein
MCTMSSTLKISRIPRHEGKNEGLSFYLQVGSSSLSYSIKDGFVCYSADLMNFDLDQLQRQELLAKR